ncbi:hypothetical protein ACVMHW_007763 [Bradyrhizobium diazoefficiens]
MAAGPGLAGKALVVSEAQVLAHGLERRQPFAVEAAAEFQPHTRPVRHPEFNDANEGFHRTCPPPQAFDSIGDLAAERTFKIQAGPRKLRAMGRCEPDLGGRFRKTQIIPSRRPRPAMAISIPAPTSAPGGGTSADRQACDRRPVSDDLRLVFTLAGRLGHRQLQHGRALAFDELRHEYVFAVGEFDRVMMAIGNVRIDLAELADAGVDGARPDPAIVVADVVGEGELRFPAAGRPRRTCRPRRRSRASRCRGRWS